MSSPFHGSYPVGGIPLVDVDVPATAVLLVVYLGLGITHAIFFFKFSKRTFIPQAMTMGFCFARVTTMSLRLAWTTHVTNKSLAIAASVFVNAGVLLIYVVNLIFLHRYTLQIFPSIPTRRRYPLNLIAHIYMFSMIPLVILVIVPGVQLYLSSDLSTIKTDRTIVRVAQCYLTVFVSIQVPLVILAWALWQRHPTRTTIPPREVTIRAAIILFVACMLTWIQAVKICQTFYTVSSQTAISPPWYLRRPIFYSGFILPELLCVIVYAVTSIRKRFLFPVRDEKIERGGATEGEYRAEGGAAGTEKMEHVDTV